MMRTRRALLRDRFQRCRAARSGAMLYSMVLANCLIVGVLGLSALTIVRVERRAALRRSEMESAQLLAWSGTELAVRELTKNTAWRTAYAHNVEATPRSFGGGTATWRLLDATDVNLADDPADAVDVQGIGRFGDSVWVHRLRFPFRKVSPLDFGLHSHGLIWISSESQITGTNGSLSTNDVLTLQGTYIGSAECQSRTGGGGATGVITEKAPQKSLPAAGVFNSYVALATALPYTGNLARDVLAPGLNTYAGGLNANGVYYINTGGNEIELDEVRLHGTLVIQGDCRVDDQALLQPFRTDYPVLIVSGNLRITTNSQNGSLSESVCDTNFNPMGAAYSGSTDSDQSDVYVNEIQGLVHIRGNVTLDDTARVRGVVICEGQTYVYGDDVELIYDPAIRAAPPAGYDIPSYVLSSHGQSGQRAAAP